MKYAMRSITALLVALTLGAAGNFAIHAADHHHTVVSGDAVKWGPAPASLPPGAQAAALLGHPT